MYNAGGTPFAISSVHTNSLFLTLSGSSKFHKWCFRRYYWIVNNNTNQKGALGNKTATCRLVWTLLRGCIILFLLLFQQSTVACSISIRKVLWCILLVLIIVRAVMGYSIVNVWSQTTRQLLIFHTSEVKCILTGIN